MTQEERRDIYENGIRAGLAAERRQCAFTARHHVWARNADGTVSMMGEQIAKAIEGRGVILVDPVSPKSEGGV